MVRSCRALSADELQSYLAERVVTYKLPRSIELVDESLRHEGGKGGGEELPSIGAISDSLTARSI